MSSTGMMRMVGHWDRASRALMFFAARYGGVINMAVLQEGEFLRAEVVKGILSQAPGGVPFKPHSKATLAIRRAQGFGGTKILVRDNALVGSIAVIKGPSGTTWVGVKRGARTKGGRSVVDVAMRQEKGAPRDGGSYAMTPKQRKWFFAMLRKGGMKPGEGKGVGIGIKIPARPFLEPIFKKFAKPAMVRERMLERIRKLSEPHLG
jgi:hypothetical protein